MPAIRVALAAALMTACGSSHPADSSGATADPRREPPDAGVSLGRPSEPGGDGGPELPATVVKSATLEGQRVSGSREILPDPEDQAAFSQGGKSIVVALKFCIDTAGRVSTTRLLRASGRAGYDQKIVREVKAWTFRPIVSEGQAVDVCTVETFIYRPKPPAAQPPASPP